MMNLEQFAKLSGVEIVDCDKEWGGKFAYKEKDHPNCTFAGFKTINSAYKGWAIDTFGECSANALFKLLKVK